MVMLMTENPVTKKSDDDSSGFVWHSVKDLSSVREMREKLDIIDSEVRRVFDERRTEPQYLYDTAAHLLHAGGKRVRSLLMMLACEAVGGGASDMLPYAVATEFMQTASLIHDDIIDDDDMRRGVESTHRKYGNRMAILAGDLLIGLAVKLVGEQGTPELLTMVAASGIRMVEGEAADMLTLADPRRITTKEEYFDIVGRKTGSFMESVARVGAILGEASTEQEEILAEYGELLGLAFQIRDDILDITSNRKHVGKSVLSDLRGNKPNYVLVHTLEVCADENAQLCLEALESGDIPRALEMINKVGAVEFSLGVAKDYAERAIDKVLGKDLENEELLVALASFAVERNR
jgi:geranylgeranyl pyrophosphate synthase